MEDNIQHDPYAWKAVYTLACTIFIDMVWPWSVHAMATLSTMLFCYFAFNYVRNETTLLSDRYPWLKKFLHKSKNQ